MIEEEIVCVTRNNKEASSGLPLPPCRICSGIASGIHYGVNTCEACKAFFRRSLIHKDKLSCPRNGDCIITDKKRGNCSFCRLKKCLDSGMSKEAVRHGRYTIAIRTKNILEVKKLEGREIEMSLDLSRSPPYKCSEHGKLILHFLRNQRSYFSCHGLVVRTSVRVNSSDTLSEVASIDSSPSSDLYDMSEEEIQRWLSLIVSTQEEIYPNMQFYLDRSYMEKKQKEFHDQYTERMKASTELFGSMSSVPKEVFKKVYLETGIDIDDRFKLLNNHAGHIQRSIIKFINFARVIPGFIDLTTQDKISLVKNSRFEYWLLGHYGHFHPDLGVSVGKEMKMHKDDMKKMWGNTDEYLSAVHEFSRTLQNMSFSLEEIAILRGIVLTFRDRCILEEPEKVERLQWKLMNCLLYLLNKNQTCPSHRLTSIIDRLTAMRNLTDMNKQISQNLDIEWIVLKNYPLVCELMTA
ncbi:hypothetical protein ScPMuIL_015767 [Solemya velum]